MNSPSRLRYSKPWLPIPDQIALLQQRGLVISDVDEAGRFLKHVNYYRFSGYCLAFEDARHTFRSGVGFADIVVAYRFDCELRDLVTEALELVEIDLRTAVAHRFGEKYGAFGHANASLFHPRFDDSTTHVEWLSRLREEINRSSELFVKHFACHYVEFPDLPIWASTELMSFGALSRMIGGLKKADRRDISSVYRLDPDVLSSLAHHFVYVRNLCAHHCRLWDKFWKIRCRLPDNANWRGANAVDNGRVFSTLLLLRHLHKESPYLSTAATDWKNRVHAMLSGPLPNVPNPYLTMGVPKAWDTHPVWR